MNAALTEFSGFAACTARSDPASAPLANAMLVLDLCGRIQFCSEAAARLFGYPAADLLGRSVRALIPELPLRPGTSGYNTAYAQFRFAEGAWRPFWGRAADRRTIPVEISLGILKLGDKRGFVLAFQHPARHPGLEANPALPVRAVTRVTDIRVHCRPGEATRAPDMRSRH